MDKTYQESRMDSHTPQELKVDNVQDGVYYASDVRRNFIDPKQKARRYQLEVLDKALEENTIVFLETGCGKTLIAVLLMEALSHLIRKPSKKIAVFLVPTVVLVEQQAKEIKEHTDLQVGSFWGSSCCWSHAWWQEQLVKYEVIVLTPEILLGTLLACFISMEMIELLIFDECHHAQKSHPYANIMNAFYHGKAHRPKIFGLTASPVIGKLNGGALSAKIDVQIEKLEIMLDAKLYAPKDRMELEALLPNPNEQIRTYQPSCEIDFIQQLGDKLQYLKNKHSYSSDVALAKDMEEFAVVHRTLDYCIYELGLWCTIKTAERLLNKEGQSFGTESIGKGLYLREAVSMLKAADPTGTCLNDGLQEDDRIDIDNILMSPKLLCLVRVLEENREINRQCIIFVDRVVATTALSSFLNHFKCLSFLRSSPLTGSQAMSTKSQQQTIEKFRTNETNLLVATSIAEEGLDIQACSMVIRFDGPAQSTRSFIQSQGRARQKGSICIVLVESGNQEQLNHLRRLKVTEKLMWEFTETRGDKPVVSKEPETHEVEFFEVESTGAQVTTYNSVQLLYRYCSKLRGGEFYPPAPEFSYAEDREGVVCEITMPSTAPVKIVIGHPCRTKRPAKRVAALEACKKLHECGALTNYLLPASEFDEETDELPIHGPRRADPTDKMELHTTAIPEALQGQWAAASTQVSLFAYALHVVAEPPDREYAEFGLFLERDLDDDTKDMVTELILGRGRKLKIQLEACGQVVFEMNQLRDAQRFQERIFAITIERKLEQEFLSLPEPSYWNCGLLYLTLPLVHSVSPVQVDWKCVNNVLSGVLSGFRQLDPQEESSNCMVENSDTAESNGQTQTCIFFQTSDGRVPVESLINSIVTTSYNGLAYSVVDVLWNMDAHSEFIGDREKYSSYLEYYKKKYQLDILHDKQPLLKAKPLAKVQNLLLRKPDKDAAGKPEMPVELVPEFCRLKVLGFSAQVVNTVYLIPSVMHRLEQSFLAAQLLKELRASFKEAAKASQRTVLQALTTANCQQIYDYERLEHFGDSFLKLAVSKHLFLMHNKEFEGSLHKRRKELISNKFLHDQCVALKLPRYIFDECFEPVHWSAPGRPSPVQCTSANCAEIQSLHKSRQSKKVKCSERHRWLPQKTISDVVEALIGGHLVDGGPDVALAFMAWLGIDVHSDARLIEEARTRCFGDICPIQGKDRSQLEGILKYEFQNKALLVEALTHSSCPVPRGNCYERLEFLGDAVLDFLITAHLYETFPNLGPGGLTNLRSATVCNESFARVAVRHHIEEFLHHKDPNIARNVKNFVRLVHNVSTGREKFYGWDCEKAPDVLGDLVESLAGAVFVDTGFDIQKVWVVLEPLLQPIVTPETFRLHPVRELKELCDKRKFTCEFLTPENTTESATKCIVHAGQILVEATGENSNNDTAKRLAAYEMLEKLKNLHTLWHHPYHALTQTLISQGKLGPGTQVTGFSTDLTDGFETPNSNPLQSSSYRPNIGDDHYHAPCQSRPTEIMEFSKAPNSEDLPALPESRSCKTFCCEKLIAEEIISDSQDVMKRKSPEYPEFDKSGNTGSGDAFDVSSDVQKLIDDLMSQTGVQSHHNVSGPKSMQTDLEDADQVAAHVYLNPEQNTNFKQNPSESYFEEYSLGEYAGRPREELHNLCAKYKWKMDYEFCQDCPQGPPHAQRYAYVVKVNCSFTHGGQTCEYLVECEGEPTMRKGQAMDSAALRAINWLKELVDF